MKSSTALLVGLAFLLVAGSAAAETVAGLPLHVAQLGDGAIRVWVGDHISSTAVVAIATEQGLVIIDTTGNPSVDRELRGFIARELGRDDFKYLINTHEHGDHTGGNAVYADCEIVGHELVAEGMARITADMPRRIEWNRNRIAELEAELASVGEDAPEAGMIRENLALERLQLDNWLADAAAPPPPTKTFADRMVLDLGDRTFELFFTGGMHTASDIAVLVPELGLLLTGDTMSDRWLTDTPGCLAAFVARSGVRHDFPLLLRNWKALLARRDEIRTLLTGHWNGDLSLAGFEARVDYIDALWEGAERIAAAGGGMERMLTEFALAARFPDLVDSPGFSNQNNYMTIVEIWRERTGQQSAAQALYALIDEGAGESAVREVVAQRGVEPAAYYFLEGDLNGWGYRFLQAGRAADAVTLFRINVELFPESWNVYDSLAEALLAAGSRDEAIAMYERSLEINPESASGHEALARIRGAAVN